MRPPGVEPGSREPESHVRSITLRARNNFKIAELTRTFIIISPVTIKCKQKMNIFTKKLDEAGLSKTEHISMDKLVGFEYYKKRRLVRLFS